MKVYEHADGRRGFQDLDLTGRALLYRVSSFGFDVVGSWDSRMTILGKFTESLLAPRTPFGCRV